MELLKMEEKNNKGDINATFTFLKRSDSDDFIQSFEVTVMNQLKGRNEKLSRIRARKDNVKEDFYSNRVMN